MSATSLSTVLVVDRGVAAVRVVRAVQSRGLKAVSVGVACGGVAASVDIVATELSCVTALDLPSTDDVSWDPAVAVGADPVDPLLLVLTAWGPDRDAAYSRACQAWDQQVITGPTVPRPEAVGGTS